MERQLTDETGVGLIVTILILLAVSLLGTALLVGSMTDLEISTNYRSQAGAFYQAESGLEQTRIDFGEDSAWIASTLNAGVLPLGLADPFPSSLTINGHTVTLATEGGEVVPGYYALGGTTTLENGSFARVLRLPPTDVVSANGKGNKVWVEIPARSTGSSSGAEPAEQTVGETVRILVTRLSVWDNAIFAGQGQSGQTINGNAEVRGSVHVIGDPDNPTTLDWSGTASILNHYEGIDSAQNLGPYASKLPSLPTREIDGQVVETLDSEVRVRHGDVNLDGNAHWGENDVSGNTVKETLDGFYTDGSVSTSGSSSITADATGDYEGGDVSWPSLDDPYTDDDGTVYSSHRDYLNAEGLTIAYTEISGDTPAFSASDGQGNSVQWDPSTQSLTIDGIVRIDGDLTLGRSGGPPSGRDVSYEGTGTIYATGDIDVVGDVLPIGGYLDVDGGGTVHNLGLIADADANLDTTSDLKVIAAIYAGGTANVGKQTRLAGAVVANLVDLGSQVPGIYHVPLLSGNLPPGMPGGPVLIVSEIEGTDWHQKRD